MEHTLTLAGIGAGAVVRTRPSRLQRPTPCSVSRCAASTTSRTTPRRGSGRSCWRWPVGESSWGVRPG